MKRREFNRATRAEIIRRATRDGQMVPASERPEYRHWINMKSRCPNPNTPNFERWGGRGIRICDAWIHSFETFFRDVGPRPTPNHSLDRFPDTNGNYEPGNVRWATSIEQARNTTKNSLVWFGDKFIAVAEAAEHVGINANTIIYRLRRGWSDAEALRADHFKGQRPGRTRGVFAASSQGDN